MQTLQRMVLAVAISLTFASGLASQLAADDVKSTLAVGDFVSGFEVTKWAGATDDKVKLGSQLCYVCRYEERPVVVVFARKVDKNLAALVKGLDAAVARNSKKQLASFVSLLGNDRKQLATNAKTLIAKSGAKRIPMVSPIENAARGPSEFKLGADAQVTVVMYKAGEVKLNHAFVSLTSKDVSRLLRDVAKLLD